LAKKFFERDMIRRGGRLLDQVDESFMPLDFTVDIGPIKISA
jgi:hypothetical protein